MERPKHKPTDVVRQLALLGPIRGVSIDIETSHENYVSTNEYEAFHYDTIINVFGEQGQMALTDTQFENFLSLEIGHNSLYTMNRDLYQQAVEWEKFESCEKKDLARYHVLKKKFE